MGALHVQAVVVVARAYASDSKGLDELRKPKFTSKYLIQHVSEKLIPAVKEWEKQYQAPVIHLGRVLSVGDGIARIYGLKSVQVPARRPVPDPVCPGQQGVEG